MFLSAYRSAHGPPNIRDSVVKGIRDFRTQGDTNQANPDRISMRQIALRFDISYSTLSRRLGNKTSSIALTGGHNRVFSKAQSDALIAYITSTARRSALY
jgi:hypothetical protein